jgi:hypothetical protein
MAKAAYCSQCGENVYVGADGRCPKGHGPESLSNYYDAPDDADPAAGSPGEPPQKKSRVGLVLLIIAIVLVLCAVGAGITTCVAIQRGTNALVDSVEEYEEGNEADLEEQLIEDATPDELVVEEAERMVEYFYPGFRYSQMAEAQVLTDGATDYHVVAESNDAVGFYITFFVQRNPNTEVVGADDPATAYLDTEGGAVWLHPQTVESGLAAFAGPNAMMPSASRAQIMTDFVAARDELVFVSEYQLVSNIEIKLLGITELDLETWYDNFTTWTSTWDNDLQAATWVERSFETNDPPGTP